MINATEVYKIRMVSISKGYENVFGKVSWVHGFNVIPKTGGSGKTFTDKKIVNRMFSKITKASEYGVSYKCEIVTFSLTELSVSDSELT